MKGASQNQEFSSVRRSSKTLLAFLALCLTPLLSGCIVIEKKSLVLLVNDDMKLVRMLYVFEGISYLKNSESSLKKAEEQLNNLKQPNLGFFVNGAKMGNPKNNPLLKYFRFDDLKFYRDFSRKRPLCAYRNASIVQTDKLAEEINKEISKEMARFWNRPEKQISDDIRRFRKDLNSKQSQPVIDGFGLRPLIKAVDGVLRLTQQFDGPSFEHFRRTVQQNKDFQWLRFEKHRIHVVLPITRKCAQEIVNDKFAKAWIRDMRALVRPLKLEAYDEGLSITLGEKRKAIRLNYSDPRPHMPKHRIDLFRLAGYPGRLIINAKAAGRDELINRFIKENLRW